ncbi:coiled-coil domain-containing protein 135, partial [Trypanosoma grayi]|uniref:coiled-coil domain-containing protein 135 n=1 Tax=Trypanosoma grayi TaxID=71804 RepID=UPI0004F4869D
MDTAATATYDATRAERFERWLPADTFPPSYSCTTPAEAELHRAVELFRTQYHEYYPNRAPLLLAPLNECSTSKVICTFIKPTVFPFEELFDLPSCAGFLADYMRYEPLSDPVKLPAVVVSPATTLQWQIGNCFELSLVLASVLVGAGYNAFVVVGYARRFVCENDHSQRVWTDSGGLFNEAESDGEQEVEAELDVEYAALVKERPVLRGVDDPEPTAKQQQQQQEAPPPPPPPQQQQQEGPQKQTPAQQQQAQEQQEEEGAPGPLQEQEEGEEGQRPKYSAASNRTPTDKASMKRLHSWVLVLPGGRKSQKDTVFVEPSSGEMIPPRKADAFYTGIEAVFSMHNYLVNLAPDAPVSALTLDLTDGTQWEGVMLDIDTEEERDASQVLAAGPGDRLSHTVNVGIRLRGHGYDMSTTSMHAGTATAASGLAVSLREKAVRPVSVSWVRELILSRAQYEGRYPGGTKTIRYTNAEVRWYAPYAMQDLRVMEVRLPDNMYRDRQQVHLLFKHRADKLHRRSTFPTDSTPMTSAVVAGDSYEGGSGTAASAPSFRLLKEWYERGRMRDAAVEGLRLFVHETGVSRSMTFYWDARDDGLWRRREYFYEGSALRKVKEFYRQRDDRLWYRSATFGRTTAVLRMTRRSSSVFADRSADDALRLDP